MLDIIFASSQCLGICLVIPCWCQAGARAVQYDKVGKMSAWSFLRVLQLKAEVPIGCTWCRKGGRTQSEESLHLELALHHAMR